MTGEQAAGSGGANGMMSGGQDKGGAAEGGVLPGATLPAGRPVQSNALQEGKDMLTVNQDGYKRVDAGEQMRKPGPKRPRNKNLQPVRQSSRRIIKKKWADDQIPEYEINTSKERHKVRCELHPCRLLMEPSLTMVSFVPLAGVSSEGGEWTERRGLVAARSGK